CTAACAQPAHRPTRAAVRSSLTIAPPFYLTGRPKTRTAAPLKSVESTFSTSLASARCARRFRALAASSRWTPVDGSIARDVGRWKRILDRLERVLGLAERALEPRVGPEPGPALFERAVAFRWDARRGAGRLRPIERPQLFDLEDLVCVDRAIDRLV